VAVTDTKAFGRRDATVTCADLVSNTLVVSDGTVKRSTSTNSDWIELASRPCLPVSDQYSDEMARESTTGPLHPGDRFLKYSIVREIGAGGYARVYQAFDAFLKREVALKIIHRPTANRQELLRRTAAEARFLVTVKHPYLVDVYDAGYDDRRVLYIAMELLRGKPLRALIRSTGGLPWAQFVPLGLKLTDALRVVHEQRVIHRDIKPENIFVMKDGTPKLLDFGIAKFIDAPAMITRKNVFHGTPSYMAPEQLGGRAASVQSDMYSLGVVFWEALAGEHPLQLGRAKSSEELLWRHLHLQPPKLDAIHPAIPERLARIVDAMLAKAPEHRPESMEGLATELRRCLEDERAQLLRSLPTPPASGAPEGSLELSPERVAAVCHDVLPAFEPGSISAEVLDVAPKRSAPIPSPSATSFGSADGSRRAAPHPETTKEDRRRAPVGKERTSRATLASRLARACRPRTWRGTILLALAVGGSSFSLILLSARAIRQLRPPVALTHENALPSSSPSRAVAAPMEDTAATVLQDPLRSPVGTPALATAASSIPTAPPKAPLAGEFSPQRAPVLPSASSGVRSQNKSKGLRPAKDLTDESPATPVDSTTSAFAEPQSTAKHRMVLPSLDTESPHVSE
jgi:serine/threonine-protein kinase